MNNFNLQSKFSPKGDQPEAIEQLTANLKRGVKHQTLWGVTGSGKTFTVANVIHNVQRPTLVVAHNKTLAAQLADELRDFFPQNAVHYFVSYYDYYQPEAYIPTTDTYIEKDSAINDEIDRLRHAATHALLTRKDVIIVASVSCIYGIGSPEFYQSANFTLRVGEAFSREKLLEHLVKQQFERNDIEFKRGTFRLKGDTLELMPAYSESYIKVEFFGDMVEKISEYNWPQGELIQKVDSFEVYPAKHFITPEDVMARALAEIRRDLVVRLKELQVQNKLLEAQRLEQRTNYDLEMMETAGTCAGIENYSRYFDARLPGVPPTTLMDYFPKDYLLIIDESHMTVPQVRGMYFGDHSRKEKLIEYGFRLPSAADNRPLKFEEFYSKIKQVIFVSATPSQLEIELSNGLNMNGQRTFQQPTTNQKNIPHLTPPILGEEPISRSSLGSSLSIRGGVVRQFIRPTGLLDPEIEIRPTVGQIKDLINEIKQRVEKSQRALVTTLTKRMAEELTEYLTEQGIKVAYIHSDVQTLERVDILHSLRLGKYDVLIGINLLREGLDLPEVSLVAILDADKEGFLRSKTSLIQTFGRAARHAEGKAIMYADFLTKSMESAIQETDERRKLQAKYNQDNGITPQTITKIVKPKEEKEEEKFIMINRSFRALPKAERKKVMVELEDLMRMAAEKMEFERAAELRDQIMKLERLS